MPERSLVLTAPVPVSGPNLVEHVATLLAADVLARHARERGRRLLWEAAFTGGGLAGQWAAEEELRRQGVDRLDLGRDAFAPRAAAVEEDRRAELGALLAGLGVTMDMEAATALGDEAGWAARTAFVRLFDAGLVVEDERVVDVCPHCGAVIPARRAVPDWLEAEAFLLRLTLVNGSELAGRIEVRCLDPELLPGAVAVVVPAGHPAAGRDAAVPLAGTTVPVAADPSVDEPRLLIPAHDGWALDLARRLGLSTPSVLDEAGVVRAGGPLDGLSRHAARAAAIPLLDAEGAIAMGEQVEVAVARCPACRTVLVPRLERHWFLAMEAIQATAVEAIRAGRIQACPPAAADELAATTGEGADWCVSQRLWIGEPVPAARCRDCGHVAVAGEQGASCGRCMGDLEADDQMLDTRFVGWVVPLAATGWPAGRRPPGEGAPPALLLVPPHHLVDVLAMVGLSLRLSGTVPFDQVAVAPAATGPGAAVGAFRTLVEEGGPGVARLALLSGEGDEAGARRLLAALDGGRPGAADPDRLEVAVADAFDAGTPATALPSLTAALAEGVPAADLDRMRALAAPFMGP